MKNFVLIFLLFFIGSCKSQTEKTQSFIQMSMNKDLSILFNVSIEARNKNNNEFHYYYSHIILKTDTLTIPSFEYFDDFHKKDSNTYNKAFIKLCKYKGVEKNLYFDYAKEYAKKLDKIYKELKVINIISNPNRGHFIEFDLDNNCRVYYIENTKSLMPYWKDKFNKFRKVDERWYYECK